MNRPDRSADGGERPGDGPGSSDFVRMRVVDNLTLVVAALVLLIAVGGWIAYAAHVNPPTQPTERTVGSVETEGSYEHGAVVRAENPVYPVGSELTDRERYLHTIAPVLNGTFTHEYAATGDDVTTETVLVLRLRSADDDGEYWSTTEPLAERRVADGGSGTVALQFEVNVSEAAQTVAQTDNELGGSPGDPEVAVVAETSVTATVDGERVTSNETHVLSIVPSRSTYTVVSEGRSSTERVSESGYAPREYGPLASYGSVLLLTCALGSLGLVVGLHATGSLRPPRDVRRAVITARERESLDEWITTGRVPVEYRSGSTVTVSSLSGLVDVGIDSGRRVIEDEETGTFYVVDDDVVYAYHSGRSTTNEGVLGDVRMGRGTPQADEHDLGDVSSDPDDDPEAAETNDDPDREFECQDDENEFEWTDPNTDGTNQA